MSANSGPNAAAGTGSAADPFAAFADPKFNVRQWLNAQLAVPMVSSTPAAANAGTGAARSGTTTQPLAAASGTTTPSLAAIAAAEAQASALLGSLQMHTADVSAQLEHGINQALARLPRTVAEVERMAADASRIATQVTSLRDLAATAQDLPPEVTRLEARSATRDKIVFCRDVLHTAHRLAADVAAVEQSLVALSTTAAASANGSSSNGASTGAGQASSSAHTTDVEHVAAAIRGLNTALGRVRAIDPQFGGQHEARIRQFERQLQATIERECLDLVRGRPSLLPKTAAELWTFTGPGPNSSHSSASPTPAPDRQRRAAKLFSILRAIGRHEVVLEAIAAATAEQLTGLFTALAEAIKGRPAEGAASGLLGYMRCVGVAVGEAAAYLYILAAAEGPAGGALAEPSPPSIPSSSHHPAGDVSTSDFATAVCDALSECLQRTLAAIERPHRAALTALVTAAAASSSSKVPASSGNPQQQASGAALLVACLAHTAAIDAAALAAFEVTVTSSQHTAGGAGHLQGSERRLADAARGFVPRAMATTAARVLYAPLVEIFVAREQEALGRTARCAAMPAKPSQPTGAGATPPQAPTPLPDAAIREVVDVAAASIEALFPGLERCCGFFPAETVSPFVNAWSRQVSLLVHCLGKVTAQAPPASAAAASAAVREHMQRLRLVVSGCDRLLAALEGTQTECFAAFLPTSSGLGSTTSTISTGGVEPDVLQTALRGVKSVLRRCAGEAKQAILAVLMRPTEQLLKGRYAAVPAFASVPATATGKAAASSAQDRQYAAGSAAPSDVVRRVADTVLDAPVAMEALGLLLDDSLGAGLVEAVVAHTIGLFLAETCGVLGRIAAPAAPAQPAARPATAPTTSVPSRLLSVPSAGAAAQLLADARHLTVTAAAVSDEPQGGAVPGPTALAHATSPLEARTYRAAITARLQARSATIDEVAALIAARTELESLHLLAAALERCEAPATPTTTETIPAPSFPMEILL